MRGVLVNNKNIITNIIEIESENLISFGTLLWYEGAQIGKEYSPPKSASPPSTTDVAEMLLDLETRTSLLEMGVK